MNSLEVSTIMPGHGQIGTEELIEKMENYLQDLEITAEDLVDKNISVEEFDSIVVPVEYEEWWFDRFYTYNLRFAFESLKKEK